MRKVDVRIEENVHYLLDKIAAHELAEKLKISPYVFNRFGVELFIVDFILKKELGEDSEEYKLFKEEILDYAIRLGAIIESKTLEDRYKIYMASGGEKKKKKVKL